MPSIVRKPYRYPILGAYGTPRTSGAPGTLGIN
jgi:hypothetical protein